MATGDLWEVAADATYLSRDTVSVWHFVQVDENTDDAFTEALKVARGFRDNYLSIFREVQSAQVQYTRLRARNLFNEFGQAELLISVAGGRSTTGEQGMPPVTAMAFRFTHDRPSTRDGAKRLCGMLEDDGVNGVITDASLLALAAGTALDLIVPYESDDDDGSFFLNPVTIQRIPVLPFEGNYRLPTNAAEAFYGKWNSGVVSTLFTTQNSRKRA